MENLPAPETFRVAAVTTFSKRRGSKELELWYRIAHEAAVDLLVLPSSFLPFYGAPEAFYTRKDVEALARNIHDKRRGYSPGGVGYVPQPSVIVGVNEHDGPAWYKSVAAFGMGEVLHWHRKVALEQHYLDKGYVPGATNPHSFTLGNVMVCPMECFEVLQPRLWPQTAHLVTASVGFGMKAKTANYECDYWDQWLSIVRANCLINTCYCVLSSNGKHEDAMTAVVTPGGEVQATMKGPGILITDINCTLTMKDQLRNPYMQGSQT